MGSCGPWPEAGEFEFSNLRLEIGGSCGEDGIGQRLRWKLDVAENHFAAALEELAELEEGVVAGLAGLDDVANLRDFGVEFGEAVRAGSRIWICVHINLGNDADADVYIGTIWIFLMMIIKR